ncbi:hypothetical protein JCM9279_006418 [Rhodotorula babjevae]
MQVDLGAPLAVVEPPPPHSTTAQRSHAVSYAFPGAAPPPPTSQSYYGTPRAPHDDNPSPRASFLPARQGPGNFSFAPHPSPRQPAPDSPHGRFDHYYVDEEQRRHAPESQPRSMVLAASPDLAHSSSSHRVSSPALASSPPAYSQPSYQQQQQYELASQGRRAAVSGPMQRVVSTIQFSGGEYTPHRPHFSSVAVEQPHILQASMQGLSSSHGHTSSRSAYTFGTATGPPTPPQRAPAQATYGAGASGPVLDWAKPRSSGMTAPAAAQPRQAVPSTSFAPAPGPSRMQLPPPPLHLSSSMRQPYGHSVYYSSSYDPAELMLRTQSNESGVSAYSTSTASSYASTGSHSSSREGHRTVHPALARASGVDSGYYSSPFMSRSSEFARSTSSSDLGGVSGLRIAGGLRTSQGRPSLTSDDALEQLRASTGRGGPSGATGPKPVKRRAPTSDIFHPPPQAMLAPGAYSASGSAIGARHGSPHSPSYAANLPTDAEFASLPTKRSRGRRPPVRSDLSLTPEEDDEYPLGYEPSEAQIAWAGLTKTGKVRKIFFCKVPGCGKCFKRGEHLKRHVRSIHTNERPFQCQWPTCKRLFSRHDNLNQHLRIHRDPGITDAEFSAALELYFGNRLAEVEREQSWFNSKGESAAARKRRALREAAGDLAGIDALGPRGGGSSSAGRPLEFALPHLGAIGNESMAVDGGEREEGEYRIGDDDDQDGLGPTLVEGEVSPMGRDDNDNGPWAARRTSRSSVTDAGGGAGGAQVGAPVEAHAQDQAQADPHRAAESQPVAEAHPPPSRVSAQMLALVRGQH